MTRLAIHLLGQPRVERDGEAVPSPRGHKAWGVCSPICCSPIEPPSRAELVSLLFGEADDPLCGAALESQRLRRLLGAAER